MLLLHRHTRLVEDIFDDFSLFLCKGQRAEEGRDGQRIADNDDMPLPDLPRDRFLHRLSRLPCHAQRGRHAQDEVLDQVAFLAVHERAPRHLGQLLVWHNQQLLGPRQVLLHRRYQRPVQLLQKRRLVLRFRFGAHALVKPLLA